MRKWVLVFLLLINVIVFFGFVMRSQDVRVRTDVEIEQAFELRLVSEVAQDSLVKIADTKVKGDIQAWFIEGGCLSYEGIENEQSADEIAGFMAEQGLSPIILMQGAAKKYLLVMAVPEKNEEKLLVESLLKAEGITQYVMDLNADAVYRLGSYANAEGAEEARRELMSVLFGSAEIRLQEVSDPHKAYFIQLPDDIDRNLINKINDVLKLTYETLKIEKKVCKGVASIKPHQ